MPEGGELHIAASHIYEANAGEHISLEIKDNGCGITDEAMDRVFTPFFTTKEGGTGLGLCVDIEWSRRITEQSGSAAIVNVELHIHPVS